MELITVDGATCNRDGLCAQVCPMTLIELDKEALPVAVLDAAQYCVRCGHCVAICPTGSLHHQDIDDAVCVAIDKTLNISWPQCEQFFRSRRSIRNFRKKTVAKDVLQELIELARYAPSGHNHQGVEWLVLADGQELHQLASIVCDWMRFMQEKMPELAASYSMDRVLARWDAGEDVILREAPVLIVAHGGRDDRRAQTSCTIALTHLELIASAMGLGACWAGFFNAAASTWPDLKQALGLPDNNICYGAMMIGYPRFTFQRAVERNPPSITWRM